MSDVLTLTVELGEKSLKAIAKLEKAMTGTAAKPAAKAVEEPKAETTETEGPTREEVRKKLKDFAAIEGKDAAIAILKAHGAASIGELDEDKFGAVIAAAD